MIKWFLLTLALIPAWCHGNNRDIHKMAQGNKIIELADNRQLTFTADNLFVQHTQISPNGKYVAFYSGSDEDEKLCIMSASGGKPTVVLDNEILKNLIETDTKPDKPLWVADGWSRLSWSPDSKFIATSAVLISPAGDDDVTGDEYILILTAKGQIYRSIKIPDGWTSVHGDLLWSPNGKMLTGEFAKVAKEEDYKDTADAAKDDNPYLATRSFLVFNIETQTVKVGFTDVFLPELMGWSRSGQSLYVVTIPPDVADLVHTLKEAFLDGTKPRVIDEKWEPSNVSPDWMYTVPKYGAQITVLDGRTGQIVRTVEQPAYCFDGWLKQGRSFLYFRNDAAEISDEQKSRKKPIETLWLSSVKQGKLNHMCLALDYDSHSASASTDGMKIAYTSNHKVFVAELIQRDPDTDEKVEMGLPLNEDDEKELLERQARQIVTAMEQYAMSNKANSLATASEKSALLGFCKPEAFLRPGKSEDVFTYYPHPGLDKTTDPSETVIGTFDAGYSWKINIYADGNVKTVPKE